MRQSIENRHKALQLLVNPIQPPASPTTFIGLNFPLLISASPAGILVDQHIEKANNWGKIFSDVKTTDETPQIGERQSVSFYFLWVNPSNNPAVINVDCPVVLKGFFRGGGNAEFFSPGYASCIGNLSFQMLQPETAGEVDVYLGGFIAIGVTEWEATLTGGLLGGPPDVDPAALFNRFDLKSNGLTIGPNATAVFEISLQFSFEIDDGAVVIDFSDQGGVGGSVFCPFVQLELLTPPAAFQNAI